MDEESLLSTILEIFVAIGTVSVAIMAIWGEWFRDRFAGPKLALSLRSSRGNRSTMNGRQALYYHLAVQNHRKWSLAKGVQIVISGIWRKAADETFKAEILAAEIPLTWVFRQFSPISPSIRDSRMCDLGFLAENAAHFQPSLYFYPNNFAGNVGKNDSVRFGIRINAENFTSKELFVVEVSWDGTWSTDLDQMEKHLVVKEIEASDNNP